MKPTTLFEAVSSPCREVRGNSSVLSSNSTSGLIRRKNFSAKRSSFAGFWYFLSILSVLICSLSQQALSQNCPTSGTWNQVSNENTYYPGLTPTVTAGSTTSITLGAAGVGANFGNAPIAVGDIVLIIQMQGAQIQSTNNIFYGSSSAIWSGAGYTNTNLLAGNMEFGVATSAVPLAGGVLTLAAAVTRNYASAAFGATGQYTYQVIRVPTYFNLVLNGTITTAKWNGSTGGVTVINAVNQLNFNGATLSALGMGFRGGGGQNFTGAAGTHKTDYLTLSTTTANGSKGEGIAGTPRYVNNGNYLIGGVNNGNYVVLDNGAANEGYPNGSFGRGAPGNAGGGGTDSDPTSNDQNSGGGGGGNGNIGGFGGNGWSSFGATGGRGGSDFINLLLSPYPAYYSPSTLIMGGGGGAGTMNNNTGVPANGPAASGVSGGGIIIVNATSVIGTGTIDVSGASGTNNLNTSGFFVGASPQIDGAGGGGAGGSILIYAGSGLAGITANAIGGTGGSNFPGANYGATGHGPGGSGAGGVIFSNAALNGASSVLGGQPGYSVAVGLTSHYGADSAYHNGVLTQTYNSNQLPVNMLSCQITVLPVTISDFTATAVNPKDILVSWSTSSEFNAAYFDVERSTDGITYTSIGQVAASGTSSETNNYAYNDYMIPAGATVLYYQLKIVDKDGNATFSKIVPIRLDKTAATITIYPNPASDYTVMNLSAPAAATAQMKLIDNAGRQIMFKTFNINAGNNSLLIDNLGSLSKGVYFVQMIVGASTYNEKLIKN
jgi:Secretion system C-terminal sorting domain